MKIKEGYILKNLSGSYVVLAVGEEASRFNGMIRLNESGCMLWSELEKGADMKVLVQRLMQEYSVTEETARQDVKEYLQKLKDVGCIIE